MATCLYADDTCNGDVRRRSVRVSIINGTTWEVRKQEIDVCEKHLIEHTVTMEQQPTGSTVITGIIQQQIDPLTKAVTEKAIKN